MWARHCTSIRLTAILRIFFSSGASISVTAMLSCCAM